jgi:hypothetical protein
MCCCSEIVERRRCCSPAPAGSTRRAATGKRHVRRADSPSPDLPLREDGDGAHLSSKLIEPSSTRRRRLRPALCATVTNLPPILRRLQAAREAVVDPVMLASVKARPVSLLGAFWHIRRETGAAALPRCRSCIHPHSDLRLSRHVHRQVDGMALGTQPDCGASGWASERQREGISTSTCSSTPVPDVITTSRSGPLRHVLIHQFRVRGEERGAACTVLLGQC